MRKIRSGIICFTITLEAGCAISRVIRKLDRHDPAQHSAQLDLANINEPNSGEVRTDKELKSVSPYEIAYFINEHPQADIANIWHRLGIYSPHFGKRHQRQAHGFFETC